MPLSQQQQEQRKLGIGASDVAAIMGIIPNRTPMDVFLEKTGMKAPFEGNDTTDWGNRLEEPIAAKYADDTGHSLWPSDTLVGPHPWMLATPDRLVVKQLSQMDLRATAPPDIQGGVVKTITRPDCYDRLVEIKNVGTHNAHEWGSPIHEDVPEKYRLQVLWQMMVTGVKKADLVCLIGGSDFRIYPIEWDVVVADYILKTCSNFWFGNVQKDIPPDSSATKRVEYLNAKHKLAERRTIEVGDDSHANELIREYVSLRAQIDLLEEDKKRAEASIKEMMGTAGRLVGSAGSVAWTNVKPRSAIDYEGIVKELKPSAELIDKHTVQKYGYRQFRVTAK